LNKHPAAKSVLQEEQALKRAVFALYVQLDDSVRKEIVCHVRLESFHMLGRTIV
jgi:hypothetical protein